MGTQESTVRVSILPIVWKQRVTKILKKSLMAFAFLIITAAVISTLFRALTPWVEHYKSEVEHHLSVIIGETVTIDALETGWYWFEPVIKLNQVSVSDGRKEAVKLSKLLVGINLFSSLWHWQIQPGVLFIDDLHVHIEQKDGKWQIEGIDNFSNAKINWDLASTKPILAWILAQQKIIIKNLSAQIHLENGQVIPLRELDLKIANKAGHYKIKGKGLLEQAIPTNFQLLGELNVNPYALQKTKGHVFLSLQHVLLKQWQGFTPPSDITLLDGVGTLQLWIDIAKGQFENVQARVRLNHLIWQDKRQNSPESIQSFKANLAWKPTTEGWQLSADKVQLRLKNTVWPENRFLLRYQAKEGVYWGYVKHVLVESLSSLSLPWPETLTPLLALNPQGLLDDSQIQIKDHKLNYLLTRFSALHWQGNANWPGVQNLSGALLWQPDSGHLKLSEEHTTLVPAGHAPVPLEALDVSLAWQKVNDAFHVTLEHFILNHANLKLSAKGESSNGALHLAGQFSASEAQKIIALLPSNHLKPKLDAWLKTGIKRIESLDGNFIVNGPLADFPFDKQPGEFVINSHLKGTDLVFAHNWPLTKNISGNLRVSKRDLEADINHADLQGIIVDKINLGVKDIGLDHETLLVHSQVDARSDKALAYILASPLKQKLGALNALTMQGLLALDLQLEAPLYPENDEVLAQGLLQFNNNRIEVKHRLETIALSEINGSLLFNQKGILNSTLTTQILNTPAKLMMRSIHDTIPYTELNIAWQTSVEALKQKLPLPLFALMQGNINLNSLIKLTDDPNDLDHLRVETSLQGLTIDLPKPFGKTKDESVPLTIDFDFNPEKAARLQINYGHLLDTDLLFSSEKGNFALQKGEIVLGHGKANGQKHKGVYLVGSLPYFDAEQWVAVKDKMASTDGQDFLGGVDITLEKTKFWSENFDKLTIKATKLGKDWSIQLAQAKVSAQLRYQPALNTLSGQFDTLRLEKKQEGKQALAGQMALKPRDLPNLDLQINAFQWGNLDLGSVNLKATNSPNSWQIDALKIKSPTYLLSAKGSWTQQGKANNTTFQAELTINDLANSLTHFNLTPAVEATQGIVRFEGGWPAPLTDFSLKKVRGELSIYFKDGRITHLSPETEGKLGLGKLLSILSLQTIPRRLKLDFSDLSKGGYSFDKFSGNFKLANGVMSTQDSTIDGPVAFASMKGTLDIANQQYDMDLKIAPHITASLPIVATIAGGPIAGIATWAASKLINQGMQSISGYSYKVTGPWQDPSVVQGNIIKKSATAKESSTQ